MTLQFFYICFQCFEKDEEGMNEGRKNNNITIRIIDIINNEIMVNNIMF